RVEPQTDSADERSFVVSDERRQLRILAQRRNGVAATGIPSLHQGARLASAAGQLGDANLEAVVEACRRFERTQVGFGERQAPESQRSLVENSLTRAALIGRPRDVQ